MSFYAIICKKIKRKSVCERQNKNVGRYLKISVKKQKPELQAETGNKKIS